MELYNKIICFPGAASTAISVKIRFVSARCVLCVKVSLFSLNSNTFQIECCERQRVALDVEKYLRNISLSLDDNMGIK